MDLVNALVRMAGWLPDLARGAGMTLAISLAAIALGFVGGASLLALRRAMGVFSEALVSTYVSFFRGTPLLVQLLMMFYLPTVAGIDLPPMLAAILAMAFNSSAFQCEILRAGRAAIAPGQLEAAQTFGLDARKTFLHIELPQILRAVWPAIVSEGIDVLKGSAIVSVIAVTELARTSRQLVASNYRPLETYLDMAIVYLVLTLAIQALGHWIQRRWVQGRPGAAHAARRTAP